MGQAPNSGAVSLRTFNRNFEGRSGTADAKVYLVSPETAAASAITGYFEDPTKVLGEYKDIKMPSKFIINDNMIDPPAEDGKDVEIVRGLNIKPFPLNVKLPDTIEKKVLLKVGDNITTDHIMPAGAKILPYRSNIPYLSQFCFVRCDEKFPERAKAENGGFIVGGHNYGQGSSREHAALVPLYLGIKAVIAKSFARIHAANLINSGIILLTFNNEADYDKIDLGDELVMPNLIKSIEKGKITVTNKTKNYSFTVSADLTDRNKKIILAGGLLNYTRENA
jgi:aconitate hydratase